jgi:hypothetical protein
MWGGIFGDDGRYDAFATLMEILRVRREHPNAQPSEYAKVDTHWAKFAACQLDDEPPTQEGVQLCSYGYDESLQKVAPTKLCSLRGWGKYGIPGGAVCEGVKNLAECPRPWS